MPLLKVEERIARQSARSVEASCWVRLGYALDLFADVLVEDPLLHALVLRVVIDQVEVQVREGADQRELRLHFLPVLASERLRRQVREVLRYCGAPRRRTGRTGRAG